jgi:hypothetical protein
MKGRITEDQDGPRSLRNRLPLGVWAYWRSVLSQAFRESEFNQPWKIWFDIIIWHKNLGPIGMGFDDDNNCGGMNQ